MYKNIFAFIFGLILLMSCQQNNSNATLKHGDILFRGNNIAGLSEAINEVTRTNKGTNYTHMGICVVEDKNIWVIHASPTDGVIKEPLELFCQPNKDEAYNTDVYRLRQKFEEHIPKAIKKAHALIGSPYDSTYILESDGYYCSELIYEVFKEDSVFAINPMTFINPKTQAFHEGWLEHYKELGIDIPEGKPGCNPNDMSTNSKLLFIKKL
ncbi:hypothetical protein E9993_17140 [Labilibacter sediminis]|nr:hypothetical protein E9993_17140 [Labilibacter sediminis]